MSKKCMSKKVMSLVVVGTMLSSNIAFAVEGAKKDESVYVTLTQNGTVKEKIVSDWIHSDSINVDIKDKSVLKDIKNVKGEEKPNAEGESLTWKSEKNDIFYQGKTDKKLPLEVKVSYTIDGKIVKPEEISGKCGKLKMNLEIINKDVHKITVKGKEKNVYTPFTTVSIVNLPIENFKNVKINTGEMISDGNNAVVTFISMPGMKESLDIKSDIIDLDLHEALEITADVTNFKMTPIMITATPKLPAVKGLKDAKNVDDLKKGLNDLKDASCKLAEGASKISESTKKLSEGAKVIAQKNSELRGGMDKLVTATEQLKSGQNEITKGTEQSLAVIKQLKAGKEKELNGVNALIGGVELLEKAVQPIKGVAGAGQVAILIEDGLSKQKGGLVSLRESSKSLIVGLDKLEKGTENIKAGSEKLNAGLTQLSNGEMQASEGAKKLTDATFKLEEGANKLANGSNELSTNMKKFDEEGVKKIDTELKGKVEDVQEIIDTKDELVKLSENYGTFTGVGEDMEGVVKFIMKTDEIKAPQKVSVQKNTNVKEEKKGFVNWIKGVLGRA